MGPILPGAEIIQTARARHGMRHCRDDLLFEFELDAAQESGLKPTFEPPH